MNSQCNGSFAQNQRADAGGNRRLLIHSLFSLSGFFGEAPLPPQDAHVGPRWATWHPMEPFYDPRPAATWAKPAFLVKKPKI